MQMEIDLSLPLCAAAIGVGQIVDCVLLRSGRKHGITAMAFSTLEWIWGTFCVYTLFSGTKDLPAWLAAIFVAQLTAWIVYVGVQTKQGRELETFELSRSEALVGGAFGALYAASSLAVWVGLNS